MITIFETGLIDYTDLGLLKPVKITEDDLRLIASTVGVCDVTDEHTDTVIGNLSNFIVDEGRLKVNEPKDLDYTGKGFSPRIHCEELVDVGDYYEPIGISMPNVGLTSKPRTKILYNSISNGENMSNNDEEFRKLVAQNRELTEEIGSLKTQIANLTKKYNDGKTAYDDLKKSNTEVKGKLDNFDELEKKAKAYDDLIEAKRQDLIKDVAGGDESKFERYSSFTTEQLEIMREDKHNSRQGRGATPQDTNTQDGNQSNPDHLNEEYYNWDEFEQDMETLGLS